MGKLFLEGDLKGVFSQQCTLYLLRGICICVIKASHLLLKSPSEYYLQTLWPVSAYACSQSYFVFKRAECDLQLLLIHLNVGCEYRTHLPSVS